MTNKSARQALEIRYGKKCMFNRAKIAEKIEQMGGIKTYKTFKKQCRYTKNKLKKLEETLTYHHLVHRSEGGATTVENGAVINELAHQYIHSLPREEEELINDMLRSFKLSTAIVNSGVVIQTQQVDIPFLTEEAVQGDDFLVIPVYENTKHKGDFPRTPTPFNRAKAKKEFKRQLDEVEGLDDYR